MSPQLQRFLTHANILEKLHSLTVYKAKCVTGHYLLLCPKKPSRSHAHQWEAPLTVTSRDRRRDPRMERRNSTRPKPRRYRWAHNRRRRKATVLVLALSPTQVPKYRARIFNDPLNRPSTKPNRPAVHCMNYPRQTVLCGSGLNLESARHPRWSATCLTFVAIGAWFGIKLKVTGVAMVRERGWD